jgi:cytochrome P450
VEAPATQRPPGVGRVVADLREERSERPRLPPGEQSFSLLRTHRFQRDTLRTTLAYRERYGDVFTVRMFHRPVVVMLGPAANHFVTVSGAENFSWREGMFGEHLIPLIGDGLITTDWEYHDRARRIMMPAFHRARMDSAVAVMAEETERALAGWRDGETVDLYHWVRDLSMSIAMRALVGLDPERAHAAAEAFERALAFYDTETWLMLLRGPGSPWWRLQKARADLDRILYEEIARRRRRSDAEEPAGMDALSMLMEARDEHGEGFTDRELRDQVAHLLFGGHDTSSSTVSFLAYELARHPDVAARVREESGAVLGERAPTVDELMTSLPQLDLAVDETLRLYPPVWFGPRRSVRDFEFDGHRIPAKTHIHYSSWVSHRLPDVFGEPDEFIPERFTPEARQALPKGAYIPFGGGRRICIGKRFGQLVVKTVAATLARRFEWRLAPGYELTVDKLPTLSPRGGLPVVPRSRG